MMGIIALIVVGILVAFDTLLGLGSDDNDDD